ncbi:MAG: hypothetical protein WCO56_16605 [Verrucomicrobiota bacterium]
MSPAQRLKEIEELKQMLVLQSDLQRQLIAFEAAQLQRQATSGVESLAGKFSLGRPWMIGLAVVGGMVAVRHWRTLLGWAPRALRWWQTIRLGLDRLGF